MPPQRRQREYETSVDPNAMHVPEGRVTGFGDPRTVIKDAELEHLRNQAQQAEYFKQQTEQLQGQLRAQLEQGASGLALQGDAIVVQGFQLTPTGLIAPDDISLEHWQQVGELIFRLEGSIQWLIGDWIVYGGAVGWGDLKKLAEALGRDYDTLRNYANVSRNVKLWLRNHNLSYNHHRAIASLEDEDQQDYALTYAAKHGFSVADLRQWIKLKMPDNWMPNEQPAPALQAERQYNIAKMTDSVYSVVQKDLMKTSLQEIQSALDALKLIQIKNAEVEARLLDALSKREKR